MTTQTAPKTKRNLTTVVLSIGIMALLAITIWVAFEPARSQAAKEADHAERVEQQRGLEDAFLEQCHTEIRAQLRDPDSAQFVEQEGVIVADDGQYTVLEDARARNGFGGMNTFGIACTAYYDKDAEVFNMQTQIMD